MIYIPITSEQAADALSRKLFALMRPNRDPADVSTHYCGWHVHPVNGTVILGLPEAEDVPIHATADNTILDDILAPFVSGGAITQADADKVKADIDANRGGRVVIADLLPTYWKNQSMTHAQADAAGYFAEAAV